MLTPLEALLIVEEGCSHADCITQCVKTVGGLGATELPLDFVQAFIARAYDG
jgi:hypothetical protein